MVENRETLLDIVGESFHANSTRRVEVQGTDSGTLIVTVHTMWGRNNEDRSCVALTSDEINEINHCVNGVLR